MSPTFIHAKRSVRITLVVLALLVSACGSDADSTSTAADQTSTTAATEQGLAQEKEGEGPIDEVTRFWIKPDLIDCVGVAPQRCMQVADSEDGEYLLFYDPIAGFEFVEGTSYVIDVRVEDVFDPPADASSLSYTLVEVISAN